MTYGLGSENRNLPGFIAHADELKVILTREQGRHVPP